MNYGFESFMKYGEAKSNGKKNKIDAPLKAIFCPSGSLSLKIPYAKIKATKKYLEELRKIKKDVNSIEFFGKTLSLKQKLMQHKYYLMNKKLMNRNSGKTLVSKDSNLFFKNLHLKGAQATIRNYIDDEMKLRQLSNFTPANSNLLSITKKTFDKNEKKEISGLKRGTNRSFVENLILNEHLLKEIPQLHFPLMKDTDKYLFEWVKEENNEEPVKRILKPKRKRYFHHKKKSTDIYYLYDILKETKPNQFILPRIQRLSSLAMRAKSMVKL